MTMTTAKRVVADALHITQVKARRILELTHDGEWHHVSKYANRVDFYDVRKALAWGRLLRRYSDLVRRDGIFTTQAIKDSSQRRIIHRFFELEKGISTRSMDVGEWPDGVYPGKRMALSIDIQAAQPKKAGSNAKN